MKRYQLSWLLLLSVAVQGEVVAPPPPAPPSGHQELGAGGLRVDAPTAFTDPRWEDGLAEVSQFRLTQFRYGRRYPGTATLVVVREAFDTRRAVKAAKDATATVPVLKVHLVKSFQTGDYRYDQAVTTFLRRADGVALRLLVDSHEWCGIAAKSWINHGQGSALEVMSYFDGHGDLEQPLELSAQGVLEDALPTWLRAFDLAHGHGPASFGLVPTQLEARAMATAEVPVAVASLTPLSAATPWGSIPAVAIELTSAGPPPPGDGVFWPRERPPRRWRGVYEAQLPHRLLAWQDGAGSELELISCTRTDYWNRHDPSTTRSSP
jgi:hypothetical protein